MICPVIPVEANKIKDNGIYVQQKERVDALKKIIVVKN